MDEIKNINQMPNIRVFYEKVGRAKFISHLDINRCMQRALRRAEIPVWYTEGFNPHPYTTFALPLSLGYESLCETMDLRITRQMPMKEIMDRLNATLPEGLVVRKVALQKNKPDTIETACYTIRISFDDQDGASVLEKLYDFDRRSEIIVTKHSKKGPKEVDIRPNVKILSASGEGDELLLEMECAAGLTLNINPTLYLDAFLTAYALVPRVTHVLRTAVLMKNGTAFC